MGGRIPKIRPSLIVCCGTGVNGRSPLYLARVTRATPAGRLQRYDQADAARERISAMKRTTWLGLLLDCTRVSLVEAAGSGGSGATPKITTALLPADFFLPSPFPPPPTQTLA